ncbi:hypothetical protein [Devosia sp. XK-2]|uniref:PIN domain-containing protein n=1 Tax=Devosia sp. XK-2 TaxID=3126689 RepID=UPI0030D54E16
MATHAQILYPPLKGEKPFQELCLRLVQHEWGDPYAQLHGRSGQKQFGVDITGADKRGNFPMAGCQVKGADNHEYRKFSIPELVTEVEQAKQFTPKLDLFVVAYMGKRDAKLAAKAHELDQANRADGLFRVVLWSWDEIVERAEPYPEVLKLLQIAEGYIAPLAALDPKRPASDLVSEVVSFRTTTGKPDPHLLGDTSKASPQSPADAIAEAKIDVWRDQIRAGNASAVVEPLRAFITSLDTGAMHHVRFRAWANLGAALEQAGDRAGSEAAFEEAANAEPDTGSSHAYRSRVLLGRGQTAEAYAEAANALELDPTQRFAAVMLVEAAPKTVSTRQLEDRLGSLATHVEVGTALASRYSDAGEHGDALRVARATEPDEWPIYRGSTIGAAILQGLESDIEVRMGIVASAEVRKLLEEAKDVLEDAWTQASTRADKARWYHVAANLIVAYRFAGYDAKADDLAIELHALVPDKLELVERAVVALVHKHRSGEALELALKHAADNLPLSALLAADIAALVGDWTNLQVWAEKALDSANVEFERSRAAEHIVLALYRKSGAEEALNKGKQLRELFAANVAFEARMAEIARRSGNPQEVEEVAARLDNFDEAALDALERFELANAYADDGKWERAASLLDGLYRLDVPSEPLSQRLFYLYRAELRSEARLLFESLSGDALRSKRILRIGAAIYERAGLLPQSLRALESALELDSSDLETRLDWVRLCLRAGLEKRASKWARKADRNLTGDPETVLEFAQVLDRYGRRGDALSVAYNILRNHWGQSEAIHLKYMSLFLMRSRGEAFLTPKNVGVDTVVFLQNEHGEHKHYRLEANVPASKDVLSPDMPFAKSLLGKKVGDKVAAAQGIGQPGSWTILEIKHKYLDLLHQALEAHETAFPGSKAFGRFRIDASVEGGLEPVFEQVRERSRHVENVIGLYRDNPVPVDTIAKLLGSDAVDASRGLRFLSDITLDSCVGTDTERAHAIQQLTGAKALLVEPVTLALWQDLELLDVVKNITDVEIQIVQATIDLFTQRLEQAKENAKQKGGSLEARGDKIAFTEPTKADREASVAYCAQILDWCRAHARIVPTEPLETPDQIEDILSPSSIATLGTAIASDVPAIIEDRRLRAFAASMGIIRTGWTQSLLMVWVSEQKISRKDYVGFVARLSAAKVGFVSVSHNDLLDSIAAGDSPDFDALVATLKPETVDHESLIGVAASFAKALWVEPSYKDDRDKFISRLLDILLTKKHGVELLAAVFIAVREQLSQLYFPMRLIVKWWFEYEVRFAEGHFVRHLIFGSRPHK